MYLLFSDSKGLGPMVIRWFTRSKWSHVDIVLSDDLSDPTSRLVGAVPGGVKDYTLQERVSHAKRAVAIKLEPHGLLPDQVEEAHKSAVEWLGRQIGRPYDWMAIFLAIGLNRNWRDEDNWFCSELAATFALRVGAPVVDPDVHYRVTPQDIFNSPFPKLHVK